MSRRPDANLTATTLRPAVMGIRKIRPEGDNLPRIHPVRKYRSNCLAILDQSMQQFRGRLDPAVYRLRGQAGEDRELA